MGIFSALAHFLTPTSSSPQQRRVNKCAIVFHLARWRHGVVKKIAAKNCPLCAKARTAILKQSRSNPHLLINSNNEIHNVCRHRTRFHRYAKQATPSTDEIINEERASPTHEVTTDTNRCNVCLADVQLEALWGPRKMRLFSIYFQSISLRNRSNNLL